MADKKKTSDAAASLFLTDHKLHDLMGKFGESVAVKGKVAQVPVSVIQEAFDEATKAKALVESVDPKSKFLEPTYHESGELKGQMKQPGLNQLMSIFEEFVKKYPAEEGVVTFWADSVKDVNEFLYNQLSNLFHQEAENLAGVSGALKACAISSLSPDDAYAITKYCSGVFPTGHATINFFPGMTVKKEIKGKDEITQYPSFIKHELGCHSVTPSFAQLNGKSKVGISYHESGPGYKDSKNRMKAVQERLQKEGYTCKPNYPNLFCIGEIKNDELTRLATFFSLLFNGDVEIPGSDYAIPIIRDKVWEKAGEYVEKYGDDTWESGIKHTNWIQLYNEYANEMKEEILTPFPAYTNIAKLKPEAELKQLTLYRDHHHELEEAFGIDVGKHVATGTAKQDIVDNAEAAIALCEKNGWGKNGNNLLQSLKQSVDNFKSTGSGNSSDAVGNLIHQIAYTELGNFGAYGGCMADSGLGDINAGALTYCEGVLKGTKAELKNYGSGPSHEVSPNTYNSFFIAEKPEGGYDIHIPLTPDVWNSELHKYLEDKFGFDCHSMGYGSWQAGTVCNVHIDNYDQIRLLAIFLSNLKGGSKSLGSAKIKPFIDNAWETASEQSQIYTTWLKKEYKKEGIIPPGLSLEQNKVAEILGTSKEYGGCDLSDEEPPSIGTLAYCEGVRVNPQSKINAKLNSIGELNHFFHGTTDSIANILVTPIKAGTFQVTIKNIDLQGASHNPALANEVIKRLTEKNFTCTGKACTKTVSTDELRRLAMLLSSLHQAYNLPAEQIPLAVDYVEQVIDKIPNNKDAYTNNVWPFTKEDWASALKDFKPGAKLPGEGKKVKVSLASIKESSAGKKKAPFNIGGCHFTVSGKPTELKAAFCVGILNEALGDNGQIVHFFQVTPATVSSSTSHLKMGDSGFLTFDSKGKSFYITLPDAMATFPGMGKMIEEKFGFSSSDGKTYTRMNVYNPLILTKLAIFLSYFHTIKMIDSSCYQKALDYAYGQADNLEVEPVWPATPAAWKEFCKIDEEKEEPAKVFTWHSPISQYVLEDGKSVGIPKEHIIELLAAGIFSPASLIEKLSDNKCWAGVDHVALEPIQAKEIVDFYFKGEKVSKTDFKWHKPLTTFITSDGIALSIPSAHIKELIAEGHSLDLITLLTSKSAWEELKTSPISKVSATNVIETYWKQGYKPEVNLDQLIEDEQKQCDKMAIEVEADKELLQKCKDAASYKKMSQKCKELAHLFMNIELLKGHQKGETYEETLAKVQKVIIKTFPKLTPLQVKLQLDIEKKIKIRKGELPAGEKKIAKKYDDLSPEEQEQIKDSVIELLIEGNGPEVVLTKVQDQYGLNYSLAYDQMVEANVLVAAKKKISKTKEHIINILKSMPGSYFTIDVIIQTLADIAEIGTSPSYVVEFMDELVVEGLVTKEDNEYAWIPDMPEAFNKVYPSLQLGVEIVLKSSPGTFFKPNEIASILAEKTGKSIIIAKVKRILDDLTQQGHVLWELTSGKYSWNVGQSVPVSSAEIHKTTYAELTPDVKAEVDDYILDHAEDDANSVISTLYGTYGLEPDQTLLEKVVDIQSDYRSRDDEEEEPKKMKLTDLPFETISKFANYIKMWKGQEKSLDEVIGYFPVMWVRLEMSPATIAFITEEYKTGEIDKAAHEGFIGEQVEGELPKTSDISEFSPGHLDIINKEIKAVMDSVGGPGQTGMGDYAGVAEKYHITYNKALSEYITKLGFQYAKELEESSEVGQKTADELIKNLILAGWSTKALMEYFSGKVPDVELKKMVKKLYDIYRPDRQKELTALSTMPMEFQQYLRKLADKMLEEGKSVPDVAWYISTNYSIEKASAREMVNKVATKPLQQVDAAVKAMQLIAPGEFIGGCHIQETLTELSAQNVAFCQGVLGKKGTLYQSGYAADNIMKNHFVATATNFENGSWKTKLTWGMNSGEKETKLFRLKVGEKIVGEFDFDECTEQGTDLSCVLTGSTGKNLPIADQDKIRKAALFLSGIDNVGNLDQGCIPAALTFAAEQAKSKNKTSKPWTVDQFPDKTEDWNTIVCSKILG
jgi:hypothetical protein